MSRRGNPYDNAKAESFMKTLKVEAVYLAAYETFEDVTTDLPRFIEDVYNLYVDDPRLQGFFGCLATGQVQSYVRPLDAVRMTAGPDGVRRSGPNQDYALLCALNYPGLPNPQLDRLPSLPLHPSIRAGGCYAACAISSLLR